MVFKRIIYKNVEKALENGRKVIIIYGPRQSGKTTLIRMLIENLPEKSQYYVGDDFYAQKLFSKNELSELKRIIGGSSLLVIDEAQKIDNIGNTLKLLIDNLPLTIIASGSASFDLANKVSEPLTGRTKTFWLYPLSYQETAEKYRGADPQSVLAEMLRFGMYPEVHKLTAEKAKEDYLYEYINNYLSKDILSFEGVRKPKKVVDLLSLLALQIGQNVSVAELASGLAMSQKTVVNYLDVLEKMFVIVNLRGFSRNLRKEIYKTSKYYFADVGVRNALIRNFNNLDLRNDAGALFENWFIIEKIKAAGNFQQKANYYFWRTYDRQEIDLIEERQGKLTGYECKWGKKIKVSAPKDWLKTYANAGFELVSPENYWQYLGER